MRNTGRLAHGIAIGLIGAVGVATAGVGVATAANGGSLTLGKHNTATKTTTLTDKHGTPLSLVGKKSKPPLSVNSSQLVKHLNAAEVGGFTPQQLSASSSSQLGFDIATALGSTSLTVIELPVGTPGTGSPAIPTFKPQLVAGSAPLAAGTYAANAMALGEGADGMLCFIGTSAAYPGNYVTGVANFGGGSAAEASVTETVAVKQGQRLGEYCFNSDTEASDSPAVVISAGFDAVRVAKNTPGALGHTTDLSLAARHRVGASVVGRR